MIDLYTEIRDKLILSNNKSGLSIIPYLQHKQALKTLIKENKIKLRKGINGKLIFLKYH